MRKVDLKNITHLARASALALLVIIGFTVIRNLAIPESFGKYGHYRAEAVLEEMAKEPIYQGADSCKECHKVKFKRWKNSKHQGVTCENCHGPALKHNKKPIVKTGPKNIIVNRSNKLCMKCHLKLPARPHDFNNAPHLQIDVEKHLKNKKYKRCIKCHNPHNPQPIVTKKKTKALRRKVSKSTEKEAIAKLGKKIYEDKCLKCHGATGDGKTKAAEFLELEMPDFSASSYSATLKEIIRLTREGKGEDMPAYKDELSEQEIQAVSRYIQGFRK
jgi:cytochrome c553